MNKIEVHAKGLDAEIVINGKKINCEKAVPSQNLEEGVGIKMVVLYKDGEIIHKKWYQP